MTLAACLAAEAFINTHEHNVLLALALAKERSLKEKREFQLKLEGIAELFVSRHLILSDSRRLAESAKEMKSQKEYLHSFRPVKEYLACGHSRPHPPPHVATEDEGKPQSETKLGKLRWDTKLHLRNQVC